MNKIDLLTLIAGGLIGFLSAVGKDIILENKKNKLKVKEFKRKKIEEVFAIMYKIGKEILKPLENQKPLDQDSARINMIIRFYFPKLLYDYHIFLKVFLKISEKINKRLSLTNEEKIEYEELYKKFMDKIVEESKKYNV